MGPKSLNFATPSAFNASDVDVGGGSHWTISVKFCTEVRGWPGYTAVQKTAERFNRLSRVHQRCRQTTDDRQTTDRQTDRQTTDGFATAKTRT